MFKQQILSKKIWIILDFNASKRYSHHWVYLDKYKKFVENMRIEDDIEVWIPKCADSDIKNKLGNTCRKILRSPNYSYTKRQNIFLYVRDKIAIKILTYQSTKFKFNRFLSRKITHLYLRNAVKEITRINKSYNEVFIVIPTADSLSLNFVKEICKNENIKLVCIRFLGSENIGVFSSKMFISEFVAMTQTSKANIRIGFETDAYRKKLINLGFSESLLFWAPIPSIFKKNSRSNITTGKLVLGFLGSARPNKGFETIPLLLDALIRGKVNFTANIQKAIFPWNNYLLSLENISKNYFNWVTLLEGNLSEEEFEKEFEKIDLLILPYHINYYRESGSGLLFEANDRNIDVIAPKGVAFDWDISTFNIGNIYDSPTEFTSIIKSYEAKDSNHLGKINAENYQKIRNQMNKKFLWAE